MIGNTVPLRLAADPKHPWYHPYWSRRAMVTLGGERITGVLIADSVAGWAEVYFNPLRVVNGKAQTFRFRGEVEISPMPETHDE